MAVEDVLKGKKILEDAEKSSEQFQREMFDVYINSLVSTLNDPEVRDGLYKRYLDANTTADNNE